MPTGIYIRTEENIKNLSLSHIGIKHGSPSKKTRNKISHSLMGHKMSKENLTKIIESHKGKHLTKEHRNKISIGNLGKQMSKEAKSKISASVKLSYITNPELRKLRGKENKGKKYSKQVREHRQAILKEAKHFRTLGFKIFDSDKIRPDLIISKKGMIYAVEVEFSASPNYEKYRKQKLFNDVIWIRKTRSKLKNKIEG